LCPNIYLKVDFFRILLDLLTWLDERDYLGCREFEVVALGDKMIAAQWPNSLPKESVQAARA
jgi:hypothetical protein